MTELIARLDRHDQRVFLALAGWRHPLLDALFRYLTHLGGASATVAMAVALVLSGVPTLTAAGARAAFALAASHIAVQLLKRTIARPRPVLPIGMAWLVRAPDRFSFPSGHAAASLSVALGTMASVTPLLGATVLVVALLVGLSRCYLGVHYPGDVAAGWLLAAGAMAVAEPGLRILTFGP